MDRGQAPPQAQHAAEDMRALGALAVATLLGACGQASNEGPPPKPILAQCQVDATRFYPAKDTANDNQRVGQFYRVFVDRCMAAHGFVWDTTGVCMTDANRPEWECYRRSRD